MCSFKAVVFLVMSVILQMTACSSNFPPEFKFGAATSSYQIEGAWDEDGKGENIWDSFVHRQPWRIDGNASGDITTDSYHRWKEDVKIASEMGLHFYRFSISWTRLFPTGFTNEINEAGVKYYSDLIDHLLEAGIEPVVTLYHWDLPVKMQDLGGWANPLIADWFADYSRKVFELYADRVKTWLTINEPSIMCDIGYTTGLLAPGIIEDQFAPYICTKNILLAHAKAYRIFDKEFRQISGGRISIPNQSLWFEPLTPDDEDVAEMAMELATGRFCHPIFSKEGGWPPKLESLMWKISLKEGHTRSRLPTFTEEEKNLIRGTADFFGLNYYTSRTIRQAKPGEKVGPWFLEGSPELNAIMDVPADGYYSASPIFYIYPEGLRKLLSWIKRSYGDWEIVITENGYPTTGLEINDYNRIAALQEHLEQIQRSIMEDGVNVTAYTVWSLLDNFEWSSGFSQRFGLYQVDINDPELKRSPRLSSKYYTCVIKYNTLDVPCNCFNQSESAARATRQSLPNLPKPNVVESVSFFKEVYENRRCIVKVMRLFAKMMKLVGSN
ncbi:myrosinase 1-like [Zerene cesonia]|uniref:myrosinase 1-like n=1 Tax=Zerene cesonia TaxID=33412 RepID=UPI0018E56CE4|nr:myrosinase 1-like [Zerene cesonia]